MKKKIYLMLFTLILGLATPSVVMHPVQAYIYSFQWIGEVHDDLYWGTTITVFPEGTTATLQVKVYNPSSIKPLNVSAVIVWLDWNQNFSSTECSKDDPFVIEPHQYHTFTISFTVPSVSIASNLIDHAFTIYVKEVNATTGPKEEKLHDYWSISGGFKVYSQVQYEAQLLYEEIQFLTSGIYLYFESIEAWMLWNNATYKFNFGKQSYMSGDFNNAKTQYEEALDLYYQALSAEEEYQKKREDLDYLMDQAYLTQAQAEAHYLDAQAKYYEALANATKTEAEAAMIEANAAKTEAEAAMKQADAELILAENARIQSIAWILFGLGFLVFGIAAVVWAYKRTPK